MRQSVAQSTPEEWGDTYYLKIWAFNNVFQYSLKRCKFAGTPPAATRQINPDCTIHEVAGNRAEQFQWRSGFHELVVVDGD